MSSFLATSSLFKEVPNDFEFPINENSNENTLFSPLVLDTMPYLTPTTDSCDPRVIGGNEDHTDNNNTNAYSSNLLPQSTFIDGGFDYYYNNNNLTTNTNPSANSIPYFNTNNNHPTTNPNKTEFDQYLIHLPVVAPPSPIPTPPIDNNDNRKRQFSVAAGEDYYYSRSDHVSPKRQKRNTEVLNSPPISPEQPSAKAEESDVEEDEIIKSGLMSSSGDEEDDEEEDDDDDDESELETTPKKATSRRGRKPSCGDDSNKLFVCDHCDRRFRRQEHLKRHFRSLHTREKPFECQECGKKFSRSDNLSQHARTHIKQAAAAAAAGVAPKQRKHHNKE